MHARHLIPLVCLVALLLAVTPEAQAQRARRVFLGYYSALSGLEVEKIPFRQLTHVSHAFLAVDEKGKLIENDRVPSKQLTTTAHKKGTKVLLSLGGGRTAVGLAALSVSQKFLQTYSEKVAKVVASGDYDGIDLHWEFPNDRKLRRGHAQLVAALRKALDAQAKADKRRVPYLLTVAIPPSSHLGKWIDVSAIATDVDWFNLAAYDMSGPWMRTAGHHAPLFPSPADPEKSWRSVSGALEYWNKERGLPPERIVVGLPMYGRALPVTKPFEELDPKKRKQHGALSFTQVRDLVGKGWLNSWDKDSKVPWLRPPDKKPLFIGYDDPNSVKHKAQWANSQGCRGLFFWAIHQDRMPDGTHWLLRSAEKAWGE